MNTLQSPTYTQLRTAIENTLSEGHLRAQKAVERQRVVTYWAVGDHLVAFLDDNPAEYGSKVMKQLAADVGLSIRTMYYIVGFRRLVPKMQSIELLSWTHYVRLLDVCSDALRDDFLMQAERNRWTVGQLTEEIKTGIGSLDTLATDVSSTRDDRSCPALIAKRGEPHLYKLIEKPDVGLVLDQGFRTFVRRPSGLPSSAKPGDVFRSVKSGRGYRLDPYEQVRRVWSYVARVIRVVDGDTMWVTLDIGFGNYIDQNLRLRGIDTPEMGTPEGRRAKAFVVNAVENKTVIVATTKVDKYDRYLADVLYAEGPVTDPSEIITQGVYLNRQLIAEGLAQRYVG